MISHIIEAKEDRPDEVSQMAERLGSRAINQKVVGSIPGRAKMTLCPRNFTLLASGGNVPVLTVRRSG